MVHVPHRLSRLFQDAISVTIPLQVTADMGVAMKRTRTKRIQKLRDQFPSLVVEKKKKTESVNNEASADSEDNNNNKEEDAPPPPPSSKKKKHMPQPNEYASYLDYMEAKYAQGVMIDSDSQEEESSGDDDDKRSVYSSEGSFLDDSELKRDVAGQVLSQSIQTKLQAVGDEDDEFFVNVGNLEVEDRDNLMDYDPLADTAASKPPKKKKKRKRATSVDSKSSSTKKKKKATTTSSATKKSKTEKDEKESANEKESPKKQLSEKEHAELEEYERKAQEQKAVMEALQKQVVDAIHNMTNEELPRKRKSTKMSLVVPEGKKPGDSVLFNNPHVAGQRLKTIVPKDGVPGKKFTVSVPAPPPPKDTDNKFSREFQDLLDEYSQAHDEWCQLQARVASVQNKEFGQHAERMKKFDDVIKEFPKNLVVPIDGSYMRKVVRRARQNRHKRKKTVAAKKDEEPAVPKADSIDVPGKGTEFPQMEFKASDFAP